MKGTSILKRCGAIIATMAIAAGVAGCASEWGDGNNGTGPRATTRTDMRNNVAGPADRIRMTRNPEDRDEIEIADRAAERIVSIPGIRQANVLLTQHNAYVAAVMNARENQLTRKTEDEIAAKVREVHPAVRNVYVSTNPEFVDRINGYVRDIRQGRPVSGFINQLNEIVQRLFPNAR